MKKSIKLIVVTSLIALIFLSLSACSGKNGGGDSNSQSDIPSEKISISGKVYPPTGVSPSSLTIVSLGETTPITSQGNYTAEVYSEGVTVIAAIPEDKEFGLMNVVSTNTPSTGKNANRLMKVAAAYKAAANNEAVELNAKTTAVSMVFVTPYFATNDPVKAASMISIIENDTKIANLINAVESVFNETDPLSNPTLQNALGEAIESVLNTTQANTTAMSKSFATKPSYSPKIIQLPKRSEEFSGKLSKAVAAPYSIDTDYIRLSITESSGSYNIDVDSREGNAADWIGEIGHRGYLLNSGKHKMQYT